MRGIMVVAVLCVVSTGFASFAVDAKVNTPQTAETDARLKHAFRRPQNNGWTFVHLEGAPSEIGFQHGYLLAPEIEDALKVTILEQTHDNAKDWQFFRGAAQNMMWPHIEPEYREEMQGIADGANAHGVKLDLWDVVALNGAEEWSYYVKQYDKAHGIKSIASVTAPEHCSAFVATGSYTKDGKIVIAHNNWTKYLDGERWTIMFDVVPANGIDLIDTKELLDDRVNAANGFVVLLAAPIISIVYSPVSEF